MNIKINTDDFFEVIKTLKSGGVVCLPTDTVYGLFTMENNIDGINKIYELKNRPQSKLLGKYYSLKDAKSYEKRFGDLNGLTIVENNQAKRFVAHDLLQRIIDHVGVLEGTSANFAGYAPITSHEHVKLPCLVYNGGRCSLGLESTLYSLDTNKILRYGYKYLEDLPEEFIANGYSYKCEKFTNPTVTLNDSGINGAYHFWYYINNKHRVIVNDNCYLSKLMNTYKFIEN